MGRHAGSAACVCRSTTATGTTRSRSRLETCPARIPRGAAYPQIDVQAGLVAPVPAGGGTAARLRQIAHHQEAELLGLGRRAEAAHEADQLGMTVAAIATEVQNLIPRTAGGQGGRPLKAATVARTDGLRRPGRGETLGIPEGRRARSERRGQGERENSERSHRRSIPMPGQTSYGEGRRTGKSARAMVSPGTPNRSPSARSTVAFRRSRSGPGLRGLRGAPVRAASVAATSSW